QYYLDNVYVSSSCYVMYVYTVFLEAADDSHFIHEIDLSGLVWPVVGDPVIDFMTCLEPESGAPYTIASRTAGESGGAPFDGSETFDEGNYILVVSVQADPGWYIADDCVFRVDGSTLVVDQDASYVVSANYARIKVGPLEAKAAITAVDFTGVAAPQAGQTLGDYCAAIAVPNGADYSIFRIICADSYDGSTLTNTSTFTAGHSYIFQIYATPADDDHLFSAGAAAAINGGTELVSMFSVDSGRYLATVTTVPMLCEAPAGLPGDVDLDGSVTSVDAVLVMRYILGYMQLSGQQLINADYDGNGNIDALDALQIMRKAMHLI
ncbi:MAG: dockerin type I repeat-containing protein, partial [Clostridia bacterium]|nr:dockerin type I repeat-containing protein [Clostridia bacterium]